MTEQPGPGYENRVFVDPETLREYDDWTDEAAAGPDGERSTCLNCGAPLAGQYCGACGQRAQSRLISIWELMRDAFGDLFELDSRLWRTLVPLLNRPGLLTADYLQGRRARYMPPFRMYLVLSLAFFVIAFFNPRESFSIFFEPDEQAAEGESVDDGAEADAGAEAEAEAEAARREVAEKLAEKGIMVRDKVGDALTEAEKEELEQGFNISINDDGTAETSCEVSDFSIDGPEWLKRRLTPERIAHVCEQIKRDRGRQFIAKLLDNVPVALFVLLPIMAFVLKALYPLSRRYYVEHLLFFVHFHAFFFLILILQVLVARLTAITPVPEAIGTLAIVAASFYIPVYLFMAMRRVYGQGRFITFLKYSVLVLAYLTGFTLTMLGAVTMAAFSI